MILKGFKQKSIKKYINKLLRTRVFLLETNKMETLGVLINLDESQDFEAFKKLAKALHIKPNQLKIIAFTSTKKEKASSGDGCCYPKDFGWNGKVKNQELQEFINTPFDALISYYETEVLELKLITAAAKAKFKIGILPSDNRLNDFIIKTNVKDFQVFSSELKKYLNIFNKINNE